jgi:hypoxanthine phosphoribosyltransferase
MGLPTNFRYDFIGKVLITPEQIEKRVTQLGLEITEDYRDSERLMLLGLLRGSVMFITDLMRRIHRPLTMDFMSVSSYAGSTTSGFVRIDHDHKASIEGWDVILVDDIIDTGHTIYTAQAVVGPQPALLKGLRAADKPDRHKRNIHIDYCGFSIPDEFVVGYGLDIDEKGRNLPYIAAVDLEKYNK